MGSKTTCLRGTGELLQTGLKVYPTEVAGQGARLAGESQQQHSQGVVKRIRPPSTEAGLSKKKTRREPVT